MKEYPEIRKAIYLRFLRWVDLSPSSQDPPQDPELLYQEAMRRWSRKIFRQLVVVLPVAMLFLGLGLYISAPERAAETQKNSGTEGERVSPSSDSEYWSCSMHPNIHMAEPGQCPICFMNLILVRAGALTLSESTRALSLVESVPALYRKVAASVRMVGKVDYDETRVMRIALWTPGQSRIQRMLVNFTGAVVKQGDPLVEVYSPDLIAVQGEYLSALKIPKGAKSLLPDNVAAARRRLLDLGMTVAQIEALEKSGRVEELTTIHSPVGGTVTEKPAKEGDWLSRGMPLYEIAELSAVWIRLQAYESDLGWLRYAQQVEFQAEAYPGRSFSGRIAFLNPFLDEDTRTVRVRLHARNDEGLLRPGMFVRAVVQVQIGEHGEILDLSLQDKWICPVHPESLRDEPGECGVPLGPEGKSRCARPLVSATPPQASIPRSKVLTIPDTAPLLTGKRALVYVEKKAADSDSFEYEGRKVRLGGRVGDYYIVLEGLKEGEKVVSRGVFKIDSAIQIKAGPSMMSLEEDEKEEGMEKSEDRVRKVPPFARASELGETYDRLFPEFVDTYLAIGDALAGDSAEGVFGRRDRMREILGEIDGKISGKDSLPPTAAEILLQLRQALAEMHGDDISLLRRDYLDISASLLRWVENFGHNCRRPLYRVHCPMYRNDMGGSWLQNAPEPVRNPYYGSEMLRCGLLEETISPGYGESHDRE